MSLKTFSKILHGPEDDCYDIPRESIGKCFYNCLKLRNPQDVINVDPISKKVLTCGELLKESIKMTKLFERFSVKKGDTIAILSENTTTYCIPVVAAFYMGIAVAPINPGYVNDELKHAFNLSMPKLVISSESCLDLVLKLCGSESELVSTVISMGSSNNGSILSLKDLLQSTNADLDTFNLEDFDYTQQTAFVLLSSGTTGLSKGVLLTHENIRAPLGYLRSPTFCNFNNDVTVLVLPFFHIFGIMIQLAAILSRSKVVVMNKFKPETFLQSIQEYKATILFIVPPLLIFLVKSPMVEAYNLSSVKSVLLGASSVSREILSEAINRLRDAKFRQMYGLTETSGCCTIETSTSSESGSVGQLVPGISAKVCDVITGKVLGPFEIGELCFKGSMIMKGYINNKNATDECIDQDGFCRSGDIGYYDPNKNFFIVDRLKELIKYNGYQVSPAELEALIITHPHVKDCGVVGIPDEQCGQLPCAIVVKENGVHVTAKDIIDFVSARISKQKQLYGGVRFVEELPKTASGKILRRQLLAMCNGFQN